MSNFVQNFVCDFLPGGAKGVCTQVAYFENAINKPFRQLRYKYVGDRLESPAFAIMLAPSAHVHVVAA